MRTLLTVTVILVAAPISAQPSPWVEQKCAAYAAAWYQALDGFGTDNLNYAFLAGSENFIAGGCQGNEPICPRSTTELDIANALTLALMNAGTASTFLPFRCPPETAKDGWTGPGL